MTPSPPPPLRFLLNGEEVRTDSPPGRLVLDYLRRDRRQVGTKEGCREGDCGACAVLLGELGSDGGVTYRAVPSCMLMLGHVRGRHVVTIEGLNPDMGLSPVQQAVVDHGASQCGFCTPGFIVSFTGFLLNATEFTVEEATNAIAGNLCRCTGYISLVRAGKSIAQRFGELPAPGAGRIESLLASGALPRSFENVAARLESMNSVELAREQEALPIGGGTDLIVQRGASLDGLSPNFLMPSAEQRDVTLEGEHLRIPAATTFEDLRRCELFTDLWPAAKTDLERFASSLIRERATVAGNIANASPIADGTILFLALDAQLVLEREGVTRQLALADFFLGYKQLALEPGERIVALLIPNAGSSERRIHFEKVSKREYLDIATVNTALGLLQTDGVMQSVTLSAGGVAPVPLVLRKTSAFLMGKPIHAQTLLDALPTLDAEIAPISDVRGSAKYKRLLLRQLFFAHFLDLFPERVDEDVLLEVAR